MQVDPSYTKAVQDIEALNNKLTNHQPIPVDEIGDIYTDLGAVYSNQNIPDDLKESLNALVQQLPNYTPSGGPNDPVWQLKYDSQQSLYDQPPDPEHHEM